MAADSASAAATELHSCSDIPCSILGVGSPSPIPMIQDVWQVVSKKGIRTVFMSIGTSASSSADLEMAESMGCPLNAVAFSDEEVAGWQEITEILKSRKRDPVKHMRPFSEGAENRWMLAKNMRITRTLPWWETGSLADGTQTADWVSIVQGICKEMKLPEEQTRLDILKVDLAQKYAGLERPLLISLLHAGFRPFIIMVRWTDLPTTNLATAHTAGFLQMAGYSLVARLGSAFLYYYTDRDLFQICSWEEPMLQNPLVAEILQAVKPVAGGLMNKQADGTRLAAAAPSESSPPNPEGEVPS